MKIIVNILLICSLNSALLAELPQEKISTIPATISKSTELKIHDIVVMMDGGSIALILSGCDNNKFFLVAKRPGRLGRPKEADQVFELCDVSPDVTIEQIPATVIKGSALEVKLIELLIGLRNNLGVDSKKFKPRIDGFINLLKNRNLPWPP